MSVLLTLASLELFKKLILPHFERFYDCTCKFEIHSCNLSKSKDKWAYNLVLKCQNMLKKVGYNVVFPVAY